MALYSRARNTRLLVISLVMASLLTITVDYRGGQTGPFEAAGRATYTVVVTIQSAVSRVLHPIADDGCNTRSSRLELLAPCEVFMNNCPDALIVALKQRPIGPNWSRHSKRGSLGAA